MKMGGLELKTLRFIVSITLIVWSFTSTDHICYARRHGQPAQESPAASISVLDSGAKCDGKTDDTKAFQEAWAKACSTEKSTMLVPSGRTCLLGYIVFSGPCKLNVAFRLDGTMIAPASTSSSVWGSNREQWLLFQNVQDFVLSGDGVIDGQGHVWWKSEIDDNINQAPHLQTSLPPKTINASLTWMDSAKKGKSGSGQRGNKPDSALRFADSRGVTVTGIKIQNSPQMHLKFEGCSNVRVLAITISSPGDSPNTDGIHLENTRDVFIDGPVIACGDDCISVQTGSSNVLAQNVFCGPGHGISIGGLGKGDSRACVSNITVRNSSIHDTSNGVRIKTWQGGSGSASKITFADIRVSDVENVIVLDQYYCNTEGDGHCPNKTTAVEVWDVHFEKIVGTFVKSALYMACSDSSPCTGISLAGIQLRQAAAKVDHAESVCWQAFGQVTDFEAPGSSCIKPERYSRTRSAGAESC